VTPQAEYFVRSRSTTIDRSRLVHRRLTTQCGAVQQSIHRRLPSRTVKDCNSLDIYYRPFQILLPWAFVGSCAIQKLLDLLYMDTRPIVCSVLFCFFNDAVQITIQVLLDSLLFIKLVLVWSLVSVLMKR
jgi:hypothetical protein